MTLFSRSAIVPTAPDERDASSVLESEIIAWYFLVAILTLLVYDAVTTMDKEVKYFWVLPMKPVGIVYFANRYIGLLGAVVNLFIDSFDASLGLQICNMVPELILLGNDRFDRLYFDDESSCALLERMLSISLNILLVLAAVVKLAILIYITVIQEIAVYDLAKDVTICGERRSAAIRWGIIDWIAPMLYGVVLLVLALRKAVLYWKMTSGFKTSRLVNVLIQDQIIYFLLVVSCCVLNILQFKIHVTNHVLAGVLSTLGSPSLLCILGSRMLFNLKEVGREDVDANRNGNGKVADASVKSVGAIEFVTLGNISAVNYDHEGTFLSSQIDSFYQTPV